MSGSVKRPMIKAVLCVLVVMGVAFGGPAVAAANDEAVKAVMDGKVDAMVADFPICALTMLRYPDAGLATLNKPLTIEPIGIALPPGDSLLVNMVTNYLGALEGTGLLELLEKRWFEDGSWLLQVP